jgi:hypothetical protein
VVRGAADLAGWLGAFTLVGAYAGTTTGVLPATSLRYQVLNALGSVGLAAVAALHGAWPSLALNILWLLIASASVAGRGPGLRERSPDGHDRFPVGRWIGLVILTSGTAMPPRSSVSLSTGTKPYDA